MEDKIKKAYHELHRLGVVHADVRASNILVSSNESVYIIDFEYSHVASKKVLDSEMTGVDRLLQKVKQMEKLSDDVKYVFA